MPRRGSTTTSTLSVEFAEQLTLRYADGIDSLEGDAREALKAQAAKRVAIRFRALRAATGTTRGSSAALLECDRSLTSVTEVYMTDISARGRLRV